MGFRMEDVFQPWPKHASYRSVCFSNECDQGNYPPLHFNSTDIQVADSQKHLGLVLDSKSNFNEHIYRKQIYQV